MAAVVTREPGRARQDVVSSAGAIAVVPMPVWKRAADIAGASLGILMISPLLLLIAVAIVVDSRGGPIYRQVRVGKGGRTFMCWKFRSMHRGADSMLGRIQTSNEAAGLIFKMREDPRRTRVGKLLRRTSLDELPQLWNVLRGDMSLVGPRPPMLSEVLRYSDEELQRLACVPGITGLWQVTLRGRHNFADMVELDTRYAANITFWGDIKILLQTVPTVVFGKGSY